MWLSPVQATVVPVSEKSSEYARAMSERLLDEGLRVEADLGPDRVGFKIRQASLQKVPYIIVVGEKEQEASKINVRSRVEGELGAMSVDEFLRKIESERKPKTTGPAAAAAAE